MAKKETVTITDNRNGNKVELPIQTGTHGTDVFDVRSMYSKLGMFTVGGFYKDLDNKKRVTKGVKPKT